MRNGNLLTTTAALAGEVVQLILPAYVQAFKDRYGKPRYYYRRPGYKRVAIKGDPRNGGNDEWHTSLGKAISAGPVKPAAEGRAPGSVALLVNAYTLSYEFLKRRDSIKPPALRALNRFAENLGTRPVSSIDSEEIGAVMSKLLATPAKANEWRTALIDMFDWALASKAWRGHVAEGRNPASGLEKVAPKKKGGHHTWTPEECEQFRAAHPEGTQARLAFEIAYWEGFRASDLIRVGRANIRDGRWNFTQHKNREYRPVERSDEVAAALVAILKQPHGDSTPWDVLAGPFVRNSHGKPFTRTAFTKAMRGWCDDAKLPHCTAHGIRKRVGCDLADSGATGKEIMSGLGQLSEASSKPYTEKADRDRMAKSGKNKRAALVAKRKRSVKRVAA